MLIGTYQHNIDDKGRLIIPSDLRSELGESFFLCKGLDGCLFAFPESEWNNFSDQLRALPMNKENRDMVRFFTAGANRVTLDKQGRIVVPSLLRAYAGLEGVTYITGASNRVEIWSAPKWEELDAGIDTEDIEQTFENIDFHF